LTRYFVTGGAGFIGTNIVRRLLADTDGQITVFDNFSTGKHSHMAPYAGEKRLTVVEGDVRDMAALSKAIAGQDIVIHLASNSDIAAAAENPLIDFDIGTALTQNVVEAMRVKGVKRIVFTSGSGVYGEVPAEPIPENWPDMRPISTYGAQKLASEALISAYSYMFDMVGTVVRFANVVGPLMTHGVSHDFMRRLTKEPKRLTILGDGQQTKPYIHVDDIISAIQMLLKVQTVPFDIFNVASEDHLTVHEIADLVTGVMGLKDVQYDFTGGSRGWRADVPNYSLDSRKIRSLGWANLKNSRGAVTAAATSMFAELAAEKGTR
jgi:UDP-glucose 4-epimerase